MKLADLAPLMERRRDGGMSFDRFRDDAALLPLRWPDDVLEQVLFEHGDNPSFVYDYGAVDLREIAWRLETISASELCEMPTGASDGGCIDLFARNPEHWIKVRPAPVGRHWEEHGTWLRAPILISRQLLDPPCEGLQVWEGRTRVGVLCGRHRRRLHVAPHHQAWVGRPRTAPSGSRSTHL
ncbi:hypothetical protein ACIRP5_31945 [Streptomyces sp. NPDC101221]|uniref:hypothetical protein n=1 Tax=Streptomyces sp. NPDC101221 TaxID=3366132 RepID=UPI003830767F